jgi:DNA repair exonuclease SbcCD ATPase subunit
MSKNLDFLLDKLYEMNSFLGGDLVKYDYRSKNGNILKILNADFENAYRKAKQAQDLRNAERKQHESNIEILKWNNIIQKEFRFMKSVIEKMNQEFSKIQKRLDDEKRLEGKELIMNCQQMLDGLQEIEKVNVTYRQKLKAKNELEIEYEENILGYDAEDPGIEDDDAPPPKRVRGKREKVVKVDGNKLKRLKNTPLTEKEKAALEKWKKKDAEINDILDSIDKRLDEMLEGLDDFDDHLERNKKLLDYIGNEAFKLNEQAQTTNAQMKIILDRFKRPGRMCIDICMGFLLATLLGIFSYLLRRYLTL